MDSSKEIKNHKKIVKQIMEINNSICKKYRSLKSDEMEKNVTLER